MSRRPVPLAAIASVREDPPRLGRGSRRATCHPCRLHITWSGAPVPRRALCPHCGHRVGLYLPGQGFAWVVAKVAPTPSGVSS